MSTIQPKIMLVVRNLKSDLPFEELKRRYEERMPQFRALPGLVQKYYSHDAQTGDVAGMLDPHTLNQSGAAPGALVFGDKEAQEASGT